MERGSDFWTLSGAVSSATTTPRWVGSSQAGVVHSSAKRHSVHNKLLPFVALICVSPPHQAFTILPSIKDMLLIQHHSSPSPKVQFVQAEAALRPHSPAAVPGMTGNLNTSDMPVLCNPGQGKASSRLAPACPSVQAGSNLQLQRCETATMPVKV